MNASSKAARGSWVLVLGIVCKPNVDDERESPRYLLMNLLTDRHSEVEYYDPYRPQLIQSVMAMRSIINPES